MKVLIRIGLLFVAAALVACSDADPKPGSAPAKTSSSSTSPETAATKSPPAAEKPIEKPVEPAANDPAALAQRGLAVYTANCIACHNVDPSLDGAIGPAIAGSTFELVEARVMRNEYPAGYTPKRETKAMIPLPYLETDLAAIVAYLAK